MAARTFDKGDFSMLVHEQERKHIREEENKRIYEEELKNLRDDISQLKQMYAQLYTYCMNSQ